MMARLVLFSELFLRVKLMSEIAGSGDGHALFYLLHNKNLI
jgi:hypothetical protein